MRTFFDEVKVKKARKDYPCDACNRLRENLEDFVEDMTFAEKRAMVLARQNGWKIKAGEPYVKIPQVDGGEFAVYRAIPAINSICDRLQVWDDWY